MTALPQADGEIDLVVSSLAIRETDGATGRDRAVAETVRVLRAGGRVAIVDFQHTQHYAQRLAAAGMVDVEHRPLGWRYWFGGPWAAPALVTARKPLTDLAPGALFRGERPQRQALIVRGGQAVASLRSASWPARRACPLTNALYSRPQPARSSNESSPGRHTIHCLSSKPLSIAISGLSISSSVGWSWSSPQGNSTCNPSPVRSRVAVTV